MTFTDGDYTVSVTAIIPSDPNVTSYVATQMWLRDYAIKLREAAKQNDDQGYYFAAAQYRTTSAKIDEALQLLED